MDETKDRGELRAISTLIPRIEGPTRKAETLPSRHLTDGARSAALAALRKAPALAALTSSRAKSSEDRLREWLPAEGEAPPLPYEVCEQLAQLDDVGKTTTEEEAAKAAGVLMKQYSTQTESAKWDKAKRMEAIDRTVRLFLEHPPHAVRAILEGEHWIRKHQHFFPSTDELHAALVAADASRSVTVGRARLAVALYLAEGEPKLRDHSRLEMYRRTGDGDRALELVLKETQTDG